MQQHQPPPTGNPYEWGGVRFHDPANSRTKQPKKWNGLTLSFWAGVAIVLLILLVSFVMHFVGNGSLFTASSSSSSNILDTLEEDPETSTGFAIPTPSPPPSIPFTNEPGKPLFDPNDLQDWSSNPDIADIQKQHPLGQFDDLLHKPVPIQPGQEELFDQGYLQLSVATYSFGTRLTSEIRHYNRHNIQPCEHVRGMYTIPNPPESPDNWVELRSRHFSKPLSIPIAHMYGPFMDNGAFVSCFSQTPMGSVYAAIFATLVNDTTVESGLLTHSLTKTNRYHASIGIGSSYVEPPIFSVEYSSVELVGYDVMTFAADGTRSQVELFYKAKQDGTEWHIRTEDIMVFEDLDWRKDRETMVFITREPFEYHSF